MIQIDFDSTSLTLLKDILQGIIYDDTDPLNIQEITGSTLLHDYIFEWGIDEQQAAVALGYASIYNHSVDANCTYDMDFEHKTIQIQTKREVAVDEELCINYNGDGITDKPVWFDAK